MRRFFCWLLGHTSFAGTNPERSLYFHCPRCRKLVVGGLGLRRFP